MLNPCDLFAFLWRCSRFCAEEGWVHSRDPLVDAGHRQLAFVFERVFDQLGVGEWWLLWAVGLRLEKDGCWLVVQWKLAKIFDPQTDPFNFRLKKTTKNLRV